MVSTVALVAPGRVNIEGTYNLRQVKGVISDRIKDKILKLVHSYKQIFAKSCHLYNSAQRHWPQCLYHAWMIFLPIVGKKITEKYRIMLGNECSQWPCQRSQQMGLTFLQYFKYQRRNNDVCNSGSALYPLLEYLQWLPPPDFMRSSRVRPQCHVIITNKNVAPLSNPPIRSC